MGLFSTLVAILRNDHSRGKFLPVPFYFPLLPLAVPSFPEKNLLEKVLWLDFRKFFLVTLCVETYSRGGYPLPLYRIW